MTACLTSLASAVLTRDHRAGSIIVSDEIGGLVSRVGSLEGTGDPDAENTH